ncbi:hypothetical protein [Nitrospirillum viridazoti]
MRANSLLASLCGRMPVILTSPYWARWLGGRGLAMKAPSAI